MLKEIHKDFVTTNYIQKSEVNTINALVNIGKVNKETILEKSKEEIFEELSEKYKNENKSLIVIDTTSNRNTQLQLKLANNKEHNYINVHLLQSYKTFC